MISEPVTSLTDYVLAGVCGGLGVRLVLSREGHFSRLLWAVAFLALASAAFLGGTHHGFAPIMDEFAAALLWKLTLFAIGIFSFGMVAGSACATVRGRLRAALLTATGIQLAVYSIWMLGHDEYRYVVFDTAAAMLTLVALHIYAAVSRRDGASYWILGGVALSAVAAAVQFFHLALHEHFNHNDLYHVLQIAAMTLFYSGGKLLRDR
jgi:Family of unknown function (DUF6962)